jgi:hypothetical protein
MGLATNKGAEEVPGTLYRQPAASEVPGTPVGCSSYWGLRVAGSFVGRLRIGLRRFRSAGSYKVPWRAGDLYQISILKFSAVLSWPDVLVHIYLLLFQQYLILLPLVQEEEQMKKKTVSREKIVPVHEGELVSAKGSSGWNVINGRQEPTDEAPADPPVGGGGTGGG